MALKTTLEKLESVQAAIGKIESGAQAYSHAGKSLTRADLPRLYEREEKLLALYSQEQQTRPGCVHIQTSKGL